MEDLSANAYLLDILSQPAALRQALAQTDLAPLVSLRQALLDGRIDRIVLTGMGASYYGLYPAWLQLASAGLPAAWVDAAELVHHAPAFITPRTLLWVCSQSGHSAEVLALLRQLEARSPARRPPAALLAQANDLSSPLAQAARGDSSGMRLLLPLHAEPEATPSTRTYLHTLAISQLAALALSGAGLAPHLAALQAFSDSLEDYLDVWQVRFALLGAALEEAAAPSPSIVLVGRGPSLTSALAGALGLQEAARIPALGLQAAEFRHGPLEMAGPGLTVFVFAGENSEQGSAGVWDLNRRLWEELRGLGVNAWLLTPSPLGHCERSEAISLPAASGIALPLAEIIPVQLLSLYLGRRLGHTPGAFRHIGKVTTIE